MVAFDLRIACVTALVSLALSGCVDTHTERFAIQGPWHEAGAWNATAPPDGWHIANEGLSSQVDRACIDSHPDVGWGELCAQRSVGITYSGTSQEYLEKGVPEHPPRSQVEALLAHVTAPPLDVDEVHGLLAEADKVALSELIIDAALIPSVDAAKLPPGAVSCPDCQWWHPLSTWNFRIQEGDLWYRGQFPHRILERNGTFAGDPESEVRVHVDSRDFVQIEIRHVEPGGRMTRGQYERMAADALAEIGIGGPEGLIQCGHTNFCGTREGTVRPLMSA